MSEYDDEEWNDEGSEAEGLVHPLPMDDEEKPLGSDDVKRRLDVTVLSTTSDSDEAAGESSVDELSIVPPKSTYSEQIVRLHARRVGLVDHETLWPPPAPMVVDNIGDQASLEAHKRVLAYRRRIEQQEEEQKDKKARDAQAAKQVRMMYKEFNRQNGVADVPPDVRYKEAIRAKRMQKHQKEQAVAEEMASRWYRKVCRPTRSDHNVAESGATLLEAARRQHHAKLKEKERHREAINNKLKQLNSVAKSIITQSVGDYVRGSFILKLKNPTAKDQIAK